MKAKRAVDPEVAVKTERQPKERESRGEVIDFAEASRKVRNKRHGEKLLFQDRERYGELAEGDPRIQLLARIQEKLYAAIPHLPRGQARYLSSPDINAFVIKGVPDVFMYEGLPRQYLAWCERNGEEPSEDALAMVFAHEMGHIRQGTEEVDFAEEESDKKGKGHGKDKHEHQQHLNNEYDADRFGLQLMARAGYNPREGLKMIRFLTNLDEGLSLPTTHPRSLDRLRELIALVESQNTVIPNTDKQPVALPKDLLELLHGEDKRRPGTELYRRAGMERLPEMMAATSNIYDAAEVARVGLMHAYLEHVDRMRSAEEIRTTYAQAMMLDNLDDVLTNLRSIFIGKYFPASGIIDQSDNLPQVATRYANREYGYMQPPSDLTEGSTLGVNMGRHLGKRVESVRDHLMKVIDEDIQKIDQAKLTEPPTSGDDHSGLYVRYRQQLLDIKAAMGSALAKVQASDIEYMVGNVNEEVYEQPWSEVPGMIGAVARASADDILRYCMTNGSPIFARLLHSGSAEVKKAVGGVVAMDSRYQAYLDPAITAGADLKTLEGRREFVEQSMFQMMDNWFNHQMIGLDYETLVRPLLNEMQPNVEVVRKAFAARLVERYQAIGAQAAELAELVAAAVFTNGSNYTERQRAVRLIQELDPTAVQAWLAGVEELTAEFKSSAGALFLGESGIGGQLKGIGRSNVQSTLFSVEQECHQAARRVLGQEQGITSLDSLIAKIGVTADYARSTYIAEISKQLKDQRAWDTATKADWEAAVTPVMQVLSSGERYEFMMSLLGPGHMKDYEGRTFPRIADTLAFAAEASPRYAELLLGNREEQVITLEPLEARLSLLELLYAHGDAFSSLRRGGYHDPSKEPYSKIGLEYLRLHDQLRGPDRLVDAITMLTKGKFLNDGEKFPVFGDATLQARIFALPDAELLQIATAAKETYVRAGFDTSFSQFVDVLTIKVWSITGVEAKLPIRDHTPIFPVANKPFADVYNHIAQYTVDVHRQEALFACQKAYGIDNVSFVAGGYALATDAIRPAVMESGKPIDRDFRANLDFYASKYSDAATPFYETQLGRYQPRAKAIQDYLEVYPIYSNRERTPAKRVQELVELIPEKTDFRDIQFAKVEADRLDELGFHTEGHRLVPNAEPPMQAVIAEFYDWYELVIPLTAGRAQAELWGRRADALHDQYLAPDTKSLDGELARLQKLFPVASFARDEALIRIGNSALVHTPDEARAVQNLTTDLARRSDNTEDRVNQSQLERINVIMGNLSRTEKKDFVLWMLGAQDQPPKTLRAYGGLREISFKDLPAAVFAATAPDREQLFLRMMSGSNGLLEPQAEPDRAVLGEFVDAAFERIFPDDTTTGITGEARRMLQTAFQTVFQEYDSYRGTQIFVGLVETMRGAQDASRGDRLVALLSELGPVFVKVGQVLSETEGAPGVPLLPEDIRESFRSLKQNAKQFSRLAAVFSLETASEFSLDNPARIVAVGETLAAASIKQVSEATRADGKEVVEKVLRPSVEKHLREDARVLKVIVERIRAFAAVPRGLEESGASYVREEADFKREVENTKKIERALREYQGKGVIRVMGSRTPEIYTYSERHIQEEKIRGISLKELMQINRDPAAIEGIAKKHKLDAKEKAYYVDLAKDPSQINLQAFDALAFQYFQGEAFHGDPHDGNILLPVEGGIAFIDSGSIGESDQDSRKQLRQFFLGFALGRAADIRAAVTSLAPGIGEPQLAEVVGIATGKAGNADKMNQILKIVTSATERLHPTFDKFLKSFGTGAYLMSAVDPIDVKLIIGAYTQGNRGSNTSLVAIGGARILRELPNTRVGKLLRRAFGTENKKEPAR